MSQTTGGPYPHENKATLPVKQVFLGGTCGGNNWREGFIAALMCKGVPASALFNPVVKDWNAEAQAREEKSKAEADILVFYIADPKTPGINISAYSLVEATMALYDKPERAFVIFDSEGQEAHVVKALNQAQKVLKTRFPSGNIFGASEAIDAIAKKFA